MLALALSLSAGCTVTLRTEQVPTASRAQWEADVTNRINDLNIRVKKLESRDEI